MPTPFFSLLVFIFSCFPGFLAFLAFFFLFLKKVISEVIFKDLNIINIKIKYKNKFTPTPLKNLKLMRRAQIPFSHIIPLYTLYTLTLLWIQRFSLVPQCHNNTPWKICHYIGILASSYWIITRLHNSIII